ncbi:10157_t:CDS:2 [Dentiscutata heterogama]|uniref:10157_t:CDS:1 n=1 Tax=Dentiscutata heterogama TaxID=1316150 RepID=A0ACA9K794_9GLOM|nr:10157_t:CDS:2 [Dentiscutata heterogama]
MGKEKRYPVIGIYPQESDSFPQESFPMKKVSIQRTRRTQRCEKRKTELRITIVWGLSYEKWFLTTTTIPTI